MGSVMVQAGRLNQLGWVAVEAAAFTNSSVLQI